MVIEIKHPEINNLVSELVAYTDETVPQVVVTALRERLERVKQSSMPLASLEATLLRIAQECAELPVLDDRTEDEILGYDDKGIPTSW